MSIKVIKKPDVYVTEDELRQYRRDYERNNMYRVDPPSFEDYVRARKREAKP